MDTDNTQHPDLGVFVAREEKYCAHAADVIVGIQADHKLTEAVVGTALEGHTAV